MNELLELPVDTQTIFNEDGKVETVYDLPQSLPIANLPTLLKNGVEVFSTVQEQLLFTYSAIATLSGTMTSITGTYGGDTCYPNLFFAGIAPPASGKGVMMYSKTLIELIHQYYYTSSNKALNDYNLRSKKEKRGNSNASSQAKPAFKVVLIPANCTSSKLMKHLTDNNPDTPSIMIESEIDTMVTANAADFGSYSDILRRIFHNESISLSRKNNDEYFNVNDPQMSLVLSGTLGQFFKLINNKEDGLFTRFLVMSFTSNTGWRSMAPCPGCVNLSDFFKKQSCEYFNLWEFISKEKLEIHLSEDQWESFTIYCEEKYTEIKMTHGDDATSIIKRHGLMLFKICMVLTGMRKYELQSHSTSLVCTMDDFNSALYLTNESLYSSLDMYDLLPGVKLPKSKKSKEHFFSTLPNEFDRALAVAIALELQIGERSADRYLSYFLTTQSLSRPINGNYVKV